jgi:hypothetical protein
MSDLAIETQTEAQAFAEALQAFGLSVGATDAMDFVDRVERCIVDQDSPQECVVGHAWTPGLYGRTCLIPERTILTSKIHKTEHQFVILKGEISVWTKEHGVVTHKAPHHGITQPDTRRVLFAHADTIWVTFHATDKTDVAAIEDDIIMKHDNQYLTGGAE